MSTARWIGVADTAKIVRKVLAREFPGIKFSVTSSKYSGGSSISAQWVDGPTTKQVEAQVGAFSGKGFDGMVDCSYSYDAWLCPDNTVTIAKRKSAGTTVEPYENPPPHPDAELVHFASSSIHTSRHHSPAFVRRVAAEMAEKTGWTAPPIVETDSYWSRKKQVPTAYFERGRTAETNERERDFTDALNRTPGDGPLVTRFDYAFDEPEPEPEPSTPELNRAITEATKQEIAENRAANDRATADPKTVAHEDRDPEARAEAEALWTETVRQNEEPEQDSLAAELEQAVTEIAATILAAEPAPFVERVIRRKVGAVGGSNDIKALIQVGDDLLLIADRLGLV